MKPEKKHQNIKIEKLPDSRVKISGEIGVEHFEKARRAALEQIRLAAEIPGFRAGKAPEAVVVKHVGGMKILEDAAQSAINDVYGDILDENNIRAIGLPSVSITKLAPGNPLGFFIETAVMPEIVFENYVQLAKTALATVPAPSASVEEKEIDAVIEDLQKRLKKTEDKELPEFNDEFVKKLGDFKDVADFREKTRVNLIAHKKHEWRDKRRAAVADKLISEAKFEVPTVIIESELDTMINQFRADVERNGLKFPDYLNHLKKKEEDIRKEWYENAVRRARLELILKHIAKTEKISPDEEAAKKAVEHILSHHKNADRFSVRMYVENMMTNQKVLEFLEA